MFRAKRLAASGISQTTTSVIRTELIQISNSHTKDLFHYITEGGKIHSEKRGGHEMIPSCPIYRPKEFSSRNSSIVTFQCGGTPSCWKKMYGWRWVIYGTPSTVTEAYPDRGALNCVLLKEGSNHRVTIKGTPYVQTGAIAFVLADDMWMWTLRTLNSAVMSDYHTDSVKVWLITEEDSQEAIVILSPSE